MTAKRTDLQSVISARQPADTRTMMTVRLLRAISGTLFCLAVGWILYCDAVFGLKL
jgi:hypothetical protein